MVVEPGQTTSAPSSSTQRIATSSMVGKVASSLPSDSFRRTIRPSASDSSAVSWTFGRKRRRVLLLAWLTLLPVITPLPVSWQRRAIGRSYMQNRSEERRVGKECVSTCRSRWSAYHLKQKDNQTNAQQKMSNKT